MCDELHPTSRDTEFAADDVPRAALADGPAGGHCQAALAASIFHFKETTIGDVKRELLAAGILMRQPVDVA